tara:strand:- start:9517 stop:9783 length:267 start_codon:yes stop_codon:yes gene_type:complete
MLLFKRNISEENEVDMSEKMNKPELEALKIAFTYMPRAIEVTKYEYGERHQVVLDHIQAVREVLFFNDIDPEEVYGEVNPDITPNSSY